MGLMFSRRRLESKKVREANKAQAHKENHERVKSQLSVEPAPKAKPKKEEAKDGADKSGAK